MSGVTIGILVLSLAGLGPVAAAAHEERLVAGRVDVVDPGRKLLVVTAADGGQRRRLELTPETEVIACRAAVGLAALPTGSLVRVKYLEKAGSPSEAQSILVLRGGR